MKQGVASKLSKQLFIELNDCYDGMFSITTSPKAQGLLNKVIGTSTNNETVTLVELEQSETSRFFGLAFNVNGLATFNAFNTKCRNQLVPNELNDIQHLDSDNVTNLTLSK